MLQRPGRRGIPVRFWSMTCDDGFLVGFEIFVAFRNKKENSGRERGSLYLANNLTWPLELLAKIGYSRHGLMIYLEGEVVRSRVTH